MITRDHPEWPAFKTSMLERVETLRDELESPLLTPEQTAAIRGEISAYRRIIEDIEPKGTGAAPRTYT